MTAYRKITLDIYLPVLNHFLFCIPLRAGLIFCGYFHLLFTMLVTFVAIETFAEKSQHVQAFALVVMVIMFILTMVTYLLDSMFCVGLILGAQKKNTNFLEVCYHYMKVKMWGLLLLIVFTRVLMLFVVCDFWYYRNLDPWRSTQMIDEPLFRYLELALEFYLFLLIKSYLIKLEHPVDFAKLYRYFYNPDLTAGPSEKAEDVRPLGVNV